MVSAHRSVLSDEVISFCRLSGRPEGGNSLSLWDGTAGAAGHTIAILKDQPDCTAYLSDTDERMLAVARENIASADFSSRAEFAHGNFSELPFGERKFDLILLDLGISSLHLDSLETGISYRHDQPLDMRLDTGRGIPVWKWLQEAPEAEIKSVIYRFGEDRLAPKIARAICAIRREKQEGHVWRTGELREICTRVAGRGGSRHTEKHPYVKTFQAFRIFINDELGHLEEALRVIPRQLKIGGRLLIISFHSLEDRRVKHAFRELERIPEADPTAKSNFRPGDFKQLTQKSVTPSEREISENPRSRSAHLRVLERLR